MFGIAIQCTMLFFQCSFTVMRFFLWFVLSLYMQILICLNPIQYQSTPYTADINFTVFFFNFGFWFPLGL